VAGATREADLGVALVIAEANLAETVFTLRQANQDELRPKHNQNQYEGNSIWMVIVAPYDSELVEVSKPISKAN
jgi:hypothetical protein